MIYTVYAGAHAPHRLVVPEQQTEMISCLTGAGAPFSAGPSHSSRRVVAVSRHGNLSGDVPFCLGRRNVYNLAKTRELQTLWRTPRAVCLGAGAY